MKDGSRFRVEVLDNLTDSGDRRRVSIGNWCVDCTSGLIQGRLGFSKTIVLLEERWESFSNIDGLGHIKFPKGRISAAFEEVRHVAERERLLRRREGTISAQATLTRPSDPIRGWDSTRCP